MTFVCLSHCDTVSSAGENKRRSARFSIAITHEQLTVKLEESPYPEASSGRAAEDKSLSRGAVASRHSCSGVKKSDTRKTKVPGRARGRRGNRVFLSYL